MSSSYLTLDTLLSLLNLPLPIAWSLPLLSLATSPSSLTSSPSLPYTLTLALLFTLSHLLAALNARLAFGSPRPLDWSSEVVVVTGGAGGLGRSIVQIFGMRGASVAVLDVKDLDDQGEEGAAETLGTGVRFWKCDVGDAGEVARVGREIVKDLGTPTILINNAGIVNGRPLLSLSSESLDRNFRVNLLSHYHTIQTFLPAMLTRPQGGTIVTVSSVLGHLGASHLSDYAAAKAGLTAMHASLRSELAAMASLPDALPGAKNIRTVLVKPGQLSTQMFGTIDTPSNFFGPVVQGIDLAKAIVAAVDEGRSCVIAAPLYARYIEWMGVLPYSLQRLARWISGVDKAMEGFSAPKQ